MKQWRNSCQWRHHHPGPHGKDAYRRAGHSFKIALCRNCWRAALGEQDGDRYQAVSLTGYHISGDTTARARHTITTWYVQDRSYNYRPVAAFTSGGRAAHPHEAELAALELCARLNRDERRWEQAA